MLKEPFHLLINKSERNGLNPYFNGTCSKRWYDERKTVTCVVLILILMEHAQRDNVRLQSQDLYLSWVLILILMEHAQRECGI